MKLKFLLGTSLLVCFTLLSACGESVIDNRTKAAIGTGDQGGGTTPPTGGTVDPTPLEDSKLDWSGSSFQGTKTLSLYSID